MLGAIAERWDFRVMYAVAAAMPILGGLVFALWDREPLGGKVGA